LIRRFIERRRARAAAALLPLKRSLLGPNRMIGVDVGSAEGMQPHWRAYEGLIDFYCFEPHQASFDKLTAAHAGHPERGKFHVLPVGLSGAGGERTLHMLNAPTGSSLYPIDVGSEFVSERDTYIYPLRETRIQTRRLDEVMDESHVDAIDIIKLDVQGAEYEILAGLSDARRHKLLLAEVEVNVCGGVSRNFSPYRGAPTWTAIDEWFAASGMRLLDISVARSHRARDGDDDAYQRNVFDVYRNSTTLSAHVWELDVVYVRDWRALIEARDAPGARKLAVALCGYRFFSEAYFMIERCEAAGLFKPDEAAGIKRDIRGWHDALRRPWHGRGAGWKAVRRILRATGASQLLRWKQYMWFDYPNG
jgi:FkbM family methyltransferase